MAIDARKIALFAAFAFLLAGALHARGASAEGAANGGSAAGSEKALTLYSVRGPSGVGIVRLFDAPDPGLRIPGFVLKAEALAQADLIAARFLSGEASVGVLPPNMAAKIASSGKNLKVAAVIGEGMLSLLSSDPSIKRFADLKGKTVEAVGQGATPDYVLRRLLEAHGLSPGSDVKLGYALAYPELAQSLAAGRVSVALLAEPFATMALAANPALFSVADVQEEWRKATGGASREGAVLAGGANYPMTTLAFDGAFAAEYPDAAREILAAVKESIEWVKANPALAGELAEKRGLGLRAPVVAAAVPKSGYVFIPAREARPALEALFGEFLKNAPASVGGVLPGDDFYFADSAAAGSGIRGSRIR